MKNKIIKVVTTSIIAIISIMLINTIVNASITTNNVQAEIEKIQKSMNTENINLEQLRTTYNELSTKYSNDEIAKMIEENKEEIVNSGVDPSVIETGTQILKTTGTKDLKNIINNDIDIEGIQKKLNAGYTPEQIVKETMQSEQGLKMGFNILLANKIFQIMIIFAIISLFYDIIIKWAIFRKAGKPGWATLIPIYRHVAYLQICGISPWIILLVLLPVIGWFILLIIEVVARFKLAKGFGRGIFFGIGLWLFPVIFETILACSKKKYIGFETE